MRRIVEVDGAVQALAFEVPGDGDRAGVEAAGGELGAQLDDPLTDRSACRGL